MARNTMVATAHMIVIAERILFKAYLRIFDTTLGREAPADPEAASRPMARRLFDPALFGHLVERITSLLKTLVELLALGHGIFTGE